jgi:hypothetical protein
LVHTYVDFLFQRERQVQAKESTATKTARK